MRHRFLVALCTASTVAILSSSRPAHAQLVASAPRPLGIPVAEPITYATVDATAFGGGEYVALWSVNTDAAIALRRYDVSGAPKDDAPTFVAETGAPSLAFDGTNFRVFWTQGNYGGSSASGIFGAVVSPAGAVLRTTQAVATTQATFGASSCDGTGQCLSTSWGTAGVFGVRFDAQGDPVDAAPVTLVPAGDSGSSWGNVLQVAHVSSGWVLLWQSGPGPCQLQVFDASLAPTGNPVAIGDASAQSCVLGGQDDRFLVAWSEQQTLVSAVSAMRFDGTGAPIDAAPLSLGTSAPPTTVAATSDGYAIALDGPPVQPGTDASVLRLDGTGKLVATTSLPVPGDLPGELSRPCLASDGTSVFVAGTTGGRASGSSNGDPTATPRRFLVGATGALSLPATPLGNVYQREGDPSAAWTGAGFLAAWLRGNVDDAAFVVPRAEVPLSGATQGLSPVTTPGLSTAGLQRVAVASNGSGYGLLAGGQDGTYAAIAPDPSSLPATATAAGPGGSSGDLDIASDGHGYLVVYGGAPGPSPLLPWGVAATWFDGAGHANTPVTVGGSDAYRASSGVAFGGSTYAVVSVFPTFLGPNGDFFLDAEASFLDAQGNIGAGFVEIAGLGPTSATSESVNEVAVGCATDACVFAWSSAGGIRTRRFDDHGVPAAGPTLLAGTAGWRAPSLAWDGTEYVLAAAVPQLGAQDVAAAWLDANGHPTSAGFTTVAPAALGSTVPLRLASDGARHTLLTYSRFSDQVAVGVELSPPPVVPMDGGAEAGPTSNEPSPEAGPPADASDAGPDAPSAGDADPPAAGSGGCGCAVPASGAAAAPTGALGLLGLLAARRRRARR
jgi:hypothetical protein